MRHVQPGSPHSGTKWSASATTSGSGQPRIWLLGAYIVSASGALSVELLLASQSSGILHWPAPGPSVVTRVPVSGVSCGEGAVGGTELMEASFTYALFSAPDHRGAVPRQKA